MKVRIDGVLLGAWASLNSNPFNILDIGSGPDLISLMLAQRSNIEIITENLLLIQRFFTNLKVFLEISYHK